jgi:hypothetical protein
MAIPLPLPWCTQHVFPEFTQSYLTENRRLNILAALRFLEAVARLKEERKRMPICSKELPDAQAHGV